MEKAEDSVMRDVSWLANISLWVIFIFCLSNLCLSVHFCMFQLSTRNGE